MQKASNRLTTVFHVMGSENTSQPITAKTNTPMAKPNNLDSHSEPLKAVMKCVTL